MTHPTTIATTLICLSLLCGCGDSPKSKGGGGQTPAEVAGGARFQFHDLSKASGVVLQNVSGDPDQKMAIPENLGQGAAALDFDNDGLLDLFIANGDVFEGQTPRAEPRCALYRNLGNWKFKDVSAEAGLVFTAWCHGAYAIDFDGDGWKDLYVTVFMGPNRFFRNTGKGRFEDVSSRWGGNDTGPSTAAAFFDADGDGDLDLYVGNYVLYDPKNPPNDGKPCDWKGLAVSCGPRGTPPAKDTFYEQKDGKLVPSDRFGFAAVKKAYTLGCVSGDFDNDGDVDLYVANDSVDNYLFENMGKGHFREAGLEYGVSMSEVGTAQAGMGVDFGDIDNDGRFDLFVTNFSQDTNTLYHNVTTQSGDAIFTTESARMGLKGSSFSFLSWGTRIVDLDLDGWQDIVVASGHVYPQVDGAPELGTTYRQFNQLFVNEGPDSKGVTQFKDVAHESGGFAKRGVSRGLVCCDLDNDGDQDLLIVEMDDAPLLLRNDSPPGGDWIGFELIGKKLNRDAIAARIEVVTQSGKEFHREICAGGSYLSTSDRRVVFGLGKDSGGVKSVIVRWPDGESYSAHKSPKVGRYYRLSIGGKLEPLTP